MNIIFSALVGFLVGGGVAVAIHFLARPLTRKWPAAGPVAGVLTWVAIVALINSGATDQLVNTATRATQTTQERIFSEYVDQLSQDPEIAAAFDGLTEDQARQRGFELAAAGVSRLDDATLRQRAEIMNKILPLISEPTCAAIAKGNASPATDAEFESVVDSLDSASLAIWLDHSKKAMIAELRQTPPPTVTEEQVEQAFTILAEPMSQADLDRLSAALNDPASSDADACWAVRTLYEQAVQLPEPHATVLTRALVAP